MNLRYPSQPDILTAPADVKTAIREAIGASVAFTDADELAALLSDTVGTTGGFVREGFVSDNYQGKSTNLTNLSLVNNTSIGRSLLLETVSPTGSGELVRATSPTLVSPALGTPASGVLTNCTGTASGLTAGNVTTNANLTGPITSVGNATSIALQTGTGTTFAMSVSPTFTTPNIGAATATSINRTITFPNAGTATEYVQIQNSTATTGATKLVVKAGAANPSDNCLFNVQNSSGTDLVRVSVVGALGVFGDHVSCDQNQLRIAMYSDHHRCGYDSHGIAWYVGTILDAADVAIMRGTATYNTACGAIQVNNGTLNSWRDIWARDYVSYLSSADQTNYVRGRISVADNGTNSSVNIAGETGGTGDAVVDIHLLPKSTGVVKIIQGGGTLGTDQLELSHDGSRAVVESKDGNIRMKVPGLTGSNTIEVCIVGGGVAALKSTGSNRLSFDGVLTLSGSVFGWEVASGGYLSPAFSSNYTLAVPALTVTQLTADTVSWGLGANVRRYRVSSDASRNVGGLAISQVTGQEFWIINVGSNNIVLKHQDAGATASNRMICTGSADITLGPDEEVACWYDGTSSRFRVRKI